MEILKQIDHLNMEGLGLNPLDEVDCQIFEGYRFSPSQRKELQVQGIFILAIDYRCSFI